MADVYLKQFEVWSAQAGKAIALAANPSLDYDARATKGWLLTGFDHALFACAAYALLVAIGVYRYQMRRPAKGGKRMVESVSESFRREPIKYIVTLYNAMQVCLSSWLVYSALAEAHRNQYTLVCNAFDQHATGMASIELVFYLSKMLDFMDTLFIVVRGKWEQFSFLHVYHHFSIFMTYWVVTNAAYDGDVYYTIVANSSVHAVMYLYYFLTSIGQKPSWGRYLTQMQMLQFLSMNAQALYIILMDCPYPKPLTIYYLAYIISLFALFFQFYLKRWTRKPATIKKTE